MALGKPTTNWLLSQAEYLREFYSQRNLNIKAWRNLYYMDEKSYFVDPEGSFVPQADDETRIILPLAFSTVEAFRALLLARPPVIDVPASEVKEVNQNQAQRLEDMLYGIWSRANVNQALQDALWHSLVDGWGILQVVYDPVAEKRDVVPIYVKSLDPIGVWPMPGDRPGTWAYILAFHTELVGTLRHTFVESRDKRLRTTRIASKAFDNLQDDDRVRVFDYWDDKYHAVMVIPEIQSVDVEVSTPAEGVWILPPTEHNYDSLPFVIWHGVDLPDKVVGSRMGVSVLWPTEELCRYTSKLVSQKASIIARYADPTLVTKTMDGAGFPKPAMRGGHIPLYPEEDAFFIMPSGPIPQIDTMLEEMMGQTETAGLPRHIMGQINVSRISGVTMNLLRTPVLMRIAFKQMNMERALEDVNETILRIIENRVTKPVFLWGSDPDGKPIEISIDPAIVNGYYRNRVKLSSSLPTDEPATVSMLAALKQMNIISERTFRDVIQQVLRDLSPQSLDDEEQQILIENLVKMPPVQMALMQEAAQQAELDILPFIQSMFSGKGQGQGSQPGLPGMGSQGGASPFGALQGMSGSMQNPRPADTVRNLAMQTERAQGGRPPGQMGTSMNPVLGSGGG